MKRELLTRTLGEKVAQKERRGEMTRTTCPWLWEKMNEGFQSSTEGKSQENEQI